MRPGLEHADRLPGAGPLDARAPASRFEAPYVVNGVVEEYLCLDRWGLRRGGQRLVQRDGRMLDVLEATRNGRPVQVEFVIDRFFGEKTGR